MLPLPTIRVRVARHVQLRKKGIARECEGHSRSCWRQNEETRRYIKHFQIRRPGRGLNARGRDHTAIEQWLDERIIGCSERFTLPLSQDSCIVVAVRAAVLCCAFGFFAYEWQFPR